MSSQSQKYQRPRLSEALTTTGDSLEKFDNLIKYIVNLSVNKFPFKRTDLVKNALAGDAKAFGQIWPRVLANLEDIYGLKVVEVSESKSTKQYISVSNCPAASLLEYSQEGRSRSTLLYLVLGLIFMKNGSMTESGLYEFLKNLGITMEDDSDPYFGNVKSLIQDQFVKQLYLKRTKVPAEGMNVDRFAYTWGERAEHEMEKKVILESICKLVGRSSVCYLQQRETAYGPEEQNNSQTEGSGTLGIVDEDDEEENEEPVPSTSRGRRARR